MILSSRCDVDLREDGTRESPLRPEGKLGTIVHFLVNLGGAVWSGTKTLAAFHRPRWRVMLVAVYQGQLRPDFAAEVDEYFDRAYLVRRPPVKGIFYLSPVNVARAIRALGLDPDADDAVYHFHTGPYTSLTYRMPRERRSGKWLASFQSEPWCSLPFRLDDLPALERVTEKHLLRFLEDHSNCKSAIRPEISQRIIGAAGGDFGATVALLEEAQGTSWSILLDRLRREQGEEPAEDDDETL